MAAVAFQETPTRTGRSADHQRARDRALDLIVEFQVQGTLSDAQIADILDTGERNGWKDVVHLGLYLHAARAHYSQGVPFALCVQELLRNAERDDNPAVVALALAIRAQDRSTTAGRSTVDADRDIARATALLEEVTGASTEAVCAHLQCGIACEALELWELQLRHYEAAELRLDPNESYDNRLATLLYNRAEVQLNLAAAQRDRGADDELRVRAELARHALRAAQHPALPAQWQEEVAIFGELLDSFSPPPGGAAPLTRSAEGEYAGYTHLCRALRTTDPVQARHHCELAIEMLDCERLQHMHLFALGLAAELEAAEAGRETAGRRLARTLIDRRWERREAMMASIESLIEVERIAAEHAELRQHAYVDELTGVGNRRALARFTESLRARGVRTATLALVDLDHFKQINDGHGHAAGDAALAQIAQLLLSGVREGDLVVRFGGDEFLLLLTTPHLAAGRRRCETILHRIAAAGWAQVADGLRVSVSCGVAHGELAELEALQVAADAALYRAKLAGRGRVSV